MHVIGLDRTKLYSSPLLILDMRTYSFLPTKPLLSSPSPSSSLHLSSSPTAKIVSPSKLSRGRLAGFLGIGAGSGLSSRCLSLPEMRWKAGPAPPVLIVLSSLVGGVRLSWGMPSSSESRESRTEPISKPSSSCEIWVDRTVRLFSHLRHVCRANVPHHSWRIACCCLLVSTDTQQMRHLRGIPDSTTHQGQTTLSANA